MQRSSLLSHLRLVTYYIPAISTGFLAFAFFAVLVTKDIRITANPALPAPLFCGILVSIVAFLTFLTAIAIKQCLKCRSSQNNSPQPPISLTDILAIVASAALLILFDRAIHGRFFFATTINHGNISVAIDYEGLAFIALAILVVLRQIVATLKTLHHKSAKNNTEP